MKNYATFIIGTWVAHGGSNSVAVLHKSHNKPRPDETWSPCDANCFWHRTHVYTLISLLFFPFQVSLNFERKTMYVVGDSIYLDRSCCKERNEEKPELMGDSIY